MSPQLGRCYAGAAGAGAGAGVTCRLAPRAAKGAPHTGAGTAVFRSSRYAGGGSSSSSSSKPRQRPVLMLQTPWSCSRALHTSLSPHSISSRSSSSSFAKSSALSIDYFGQCTARRSFPCLRSVTRRIGPLPAVIMGSAHQTRDHGHGHHHHHHHDNTYLVSANKNDPGVRITRIGLLSNLGMAIAKFVGGWAFNSKAMIADAWHSIADLASDILTLATVSWSLKPPSDRFPMGYGKVEGLGSLGVSGMLLVGGFYMGWESAVSLIGHFYPDAAHEIFEHLGGGHGHGHGHSHSHSHAGLGIPSVHAAWLAGGTILVKEWLYRATMKVAKERKSSVLASNAIHHRIDSLTGIVTLVAIVGANALQDAAWLDPVGGLLISIMVVNAGWGNTKAALQELIDKTIDDDVKASVRKHTQRALANISEGHQAELREVTGVKSGQNYLVDLEMSVPGAWTVTDVRELEDAVRTQVGGKVRGVRRVRVRFVPDDVESDKKFDEFISGSVSPPPEELEADQHDHDRDHSNGHGHKHKH